MSGRATAASARAEPTAIDRTHGAQPARCWIATVSREHVQCGIAGSFAQACLPATEVDIAPLIPALTFLPDKRRWGFPFRRGHFEIPAADMTRIAAAMGCDLSLIAGDKDEADHAEHGASFQVCEGDRG